MKDYIIERTDVPPLVGMTLGDVKEVFERLCEDYGHDAVLTALKHKGSCPIVEVEIPLPKHSLMNE